MIKYTKTYYNYYGYPLDTSVFVPSELTGLQMVDVHHLEIGKGNKARLNAPIEKLIGLTRWEHTAYGDKPQYQEFLEDAHSMFMGNQQPYIYVNPNHPAFDLFLDTEFKQELLKLRNG